MKKLEKKAKITKNYKKEVNFMDEEAKKRIAEFRFGVIHELVGNRRLSRGEKELILKEKTTYEWDIPFSGRSYIGRSTILRWLSIYEQGGGRLESLYPYDRQDKGRSRVMSQEISHALINLKKELKGASLPVIISTARERGILSIDEKISQPTIYRLFKREGLMNEETVYVDRRRFESELPNDMWQSDCLHGPQVISEGKLRKTYLFAFIDDMSRLIPHAEFFLHERIDSYTKALMKAFCKRGLPRKLYLDNGPTFRSRHLGHITASLGVALIHSKPYQPEGRGKIERWFKTVRMQFLSSIKDGLNIDELNKKLQQWIEDDYHLRVHATTGEKPIQRFLKHLHLVREAPRDIVDYFRIKVLRRVDKDRTVSLHNKTYEAPAGLIGKEVALLYSEDDPSRIEVFYENKSFGMLTPLNVNINCNIKRKRYIVELSQPVPSSPLKKEYAGGKLFEKKGNKND
jgi:putative transposase